MLEIIQSFKHCWHATGDLLILCSRNVFLDLISEYSLKSRILQKRLYVQGWWHICPERNGNSWKLCCMWDLLVWRDNNHWIISPVHALLYNSYMLIDSLAHCLMDTPKYILVSRDNRHGIIVNTLLHMLQSPIWFLPIIIFWSQTKQGCFLLCTTITESRDIRNCTMLDMQWVVLIQPAS